MSTLTRDALWRELKQKTFAPLYLLFGAETYLRDRAADAITDAALRDSSLREFNDTRFGLASADVQQAIAAAEQLPMMSAKRVVRVTDFAKLREADEEALVRYLARPVESTILIFVADELDKRRKLSKTLLDVCNAVEFPPLKDEELATWAKARLKELKADADPRTLHQIIALVGSDVRTLANELDKLAAAAFDTHGRITMESVDALVGRSRVLSNFDLSDYLIARNRPRALQTLAKILDDGAEPLMLIGLIASNYHRLALAKELMSRGATNEEVYRSVAMPYGKREDFLATARRSESTRLARSVELVAQADHAIKTRGQHHARLQLEMLVCELSA